MLTNVQIFKNENPDDKMKQRPTCEFQELKNQEKAFSPTSFLRFTKKKTERKKNFQLFYF